VTRLFLALLLLSSSFVAGPQVSPDNSARSGVLITIKVLNGKNGRPVWRESPNVYIGNSTENINPRTDRHGQANVRIPTNAESVK
jgi:hypothetical protein